MGGYGVVLWDESKGPVGVMLGACAKVRRGEGLSQMEAWQVGLGAGAMGAILQERLGLSGVVHTSVAACASGVMALHRAAGAVERGECERALVVAADASLFELFEGSFARLGVLLPGALDEGLSPSALETGRAVWRCEPYGEKGEGFFVAEAGAAVMVEKLEVGSEKLEGVVAWLEETWAGGDGTGIVAVDEEMQGLRAGLKRCAKGRGVGFWCRGHGDGDIGA